MLYVILRHIILAASLPALVSCAVSGDPPNQKDTERERKEFSSEDKRIARALSIGGDELIDSQDAAYKSRLCSMALEAIEDQMESSRLLNREQQETFASVRRMYSERASKGLSSEEQVEMRRRIEGQYPEVSDRARFVVGCLRELT